jgi:anti-anti-sigma regulatory factor
MASTFKIILHNENNCIHFKLYGDFDGSSALELINSLGEDKMRLHEIIIDTNNLTIVHSFGREVFKKNIKALKRRCHNLIFIGKNKRYLEI